MASDREPFEHHRAADEPVTCFTCGQRQRLILPGKGERAVCCRCGTRLEEHKTRSLSRTRAFALTALILYIPANVLPIMSFEYYGLVEHNTVWSGVLVLAKSRMWLVAGVVFIASMLAPLAKLLGLLYLSISVKSGKPRTKTHIYRVIRAVGTWAMLDIFLVSVLVALVKLGQLASVSPGPGALPFTLVVVFTILATESFDPKWIWTRERLA